MKLQTLKSIIEKKKNKSEFAIVTNLSTTLALDKIAEKYNTKVIRTAVGEINVVKKCSKASLLGH